MESVPQIETHEIDEPLEATRLQKIGRKALDIAVVTVGAGITYAAVKNGYLDAIPTPVKLSEADPVSLILPSAVIGGLITTPIRNRIDKNRTRTII